MTRRTTINLDVDLARAAQDALGARTLTDAIHLALRESIDHRNRAMLLQHDFSLLTPERLDEQRSSDARPQPVPDR